VNTYDIPIKRCGIKIKKIRRDEKVMAEAFELAIEEAIPDVGELLQGIKRRLREEGLGHLIIGGEEEEEV